MGRGSNWTSNDDVEMCKSWLHVSECPLTGKDQKFVNFWEKIMKHMNKKLKAGDAERTLRAAQCRFALINASVAKFVSSYAKAERTAPSGTNLIDMERRAMEIYRLEQAGGKSFDYKECWLVLKCNPKWQAPRAPVNAQPAQSVASDEVGSPEMQLPTTPSATNSQNQSSPITYRPMGSKRAKLDMKQAKERGRATQAMESANELAGRRILCLQDQVALGYFRLQDQDVDPELRDIFLKRRARLLREMGEEVLPARPAVHVDIPAENEDIPEGLHDGAEAREFSQVTNDDDMFCYGAQAPRVQMGGTSSNPGLTEEFVLDGGTSSASITDGAHYNKLQDFF